ncbi:MAG: sulfite exporter TauE/SafE family protein [Myxococcota bacterium]
MDIVTELITAALFFVVSAVSAVVGVGGGIVYNPTLLLLNYDLKTVALPASLFLIFLTSSSATYGYYRQKLIDFKMGFGMGIASIFGAPIGHYLTTIFSSLMIVVLLAAIVTAVGVKLLLKFRENENDGGATELKENRYIFGVALGFFVSILATMVGIGGGIIMGPALIFMGYTPKKAVATTTFAMIFTSLAGFTSYLSTVKVNPFLLLVFGVTVLAGGQVGSRIISPRVNSRYIQATLGILLILVAIRILHSYT